MRHSDFYSGYPEALDMSGLVLGACFPIESWHEREDRALEKGWEQQMPPLLLASVGLWNLG